MTLRTKRAISTVVLTTLLGIGYVFYARSSSAPAANDLKGWAIAILVFIGISIAADIVLQILARIIFSISIAVTEREKDEKQIERIINASMVEDEMDKRVDLKSSQVQNIISGIGMVAMLIALAMGIDAVTAIHIMFAGAVLAMIGGGITGIYYFERGIGNG